jgi:hypothetical protein
MSPQRNEKLVKFTIAKWKFPKRKKKGVRNEKKRQNYSRKNFGQVTTIVYF